MEAYRRGRSICRRRRRRRGSTRTIVHGRHAWWRRRNTHAWSTRSTRRTRNTVHARGIAWVATIAVTGLATRGGRWRGLLLPGGSAGSTVTTAGSATVSVVASVALRSSPGRWTLVARTIVVAAVVAAPLLPGGNVTGWRTTLLPWLHVMVIVARIGTGFDTTRRLFTRSATGEFLHKLLYCVRYPYILKEKKVRKKTYLHLSVDSITAANRFGTTTKAVVVVTPVSTALAVRTIASHVSSVTANTTDDVSSEVALLGTVVFAMTDLTT